MATEFKSQICTTVEQSKRLLGLGLKPGTADMTWKFSYLLKGVPQYDCLAESTWDKVTMERYEQHCFWMNLHEHWKRPDGTQMSSEEVYAEITKKDIPAWSMHRLIEMMPRTIRANDELFFLLVSKEDVFYDNTEGTAYSSFINRNGLYYNITLCIEWLIKEGYFPKEYLK